MSTVIPEDAPAVAFDPIPATDADETDEEGVPPELWFDRSSITADVMVTLEGVSEEDWWQYAPEGRVCEYLDGIVYMPSPASDEHQDEVGFWFDLLNGFRLERRDDLVVRLGPGVLRLAPRRNPEPDVFVLPAGPGPHDPPALMVVEVLSKSTRKHDTGVKKDRFREAGLLEIVYVDQERHRLITHRRVDDLYAVEIVEDGPWRSSSLPGFWVQVPWLWASPLPNPRHCLRTILAGPPA